MKRLTMLFVAVLAATTFAQGRDFGGTWVLDAEKSSTKQGPGTMTIVLGANEFKVTMGDGTRAATLAFKLDGTETELEHGNKGKAAWKGDKLEATIISSRGPSSVTFSREGAWLVQEGKSSHGPEKLYFKKAPAK